MYRPRVSERTSISCNNCTLGQTIEMKVRQYLENGEPIEDMAPLLYTERSEGVRADTNIRTDKYELAVEAMAIASESNTEKRKSRHKMNEDAKVDKKPDGEPPTDKGGTPNVDTTK